MNNKKNKRLLRSKKTRYKLNSLSVMRLTVHRTSRHIYAQIISTDNSKTLVAASTVEKNIKNQLKIEKIHSGNKKAATIIGKEIAIRAIKKSIQKISFDRSGFKYHGCIKVLAESARNSGLQF